MDLRRTERSPFSTGGGDLIGDIQRQNRRRILKRAAQITTLGLALLLAGLGIKHLADQRDRNSVIERVEGQYVQGTVADLVGAVELAELGLERHPDHVPLRGARALMRAHLWAEFGAEEAAATDAVAALQPSAAKTIGEGMLAFAAGDIDAAAGALDVGLGESPSMFETLELDWLRGMVAAARAESDPEGLLETTRALGERVEAGDAGTSLRRVHAYLLLLSGQSQDALAMLAAAREQARSHYGLAADEALFNAHLHQELGGVASVAEQLLAMPPEALSPRDRAHAALSRAVAHVAEGEPKDALSQLDDAWPNLSPWNMLARRLAVQTSLDAGDTSRYEDWLEASAFTEDEKKIYSAWATLIGGDVMKALAQLEKAPQAHPWVALLQALALVEQGRWQEAKPWVDRAGKMLPGRHDLEVAAARVDLRLGDKALALRRLEALAEQEAHAPRAFTGLGEAHLLQDGKPEDASKRDKKAKRALEKAIDREAVPAEAQYLLSGIWHRRRMKDPEAEKKALELLRDAAKTNPSLPHYQVALASYLADLGYTREALERMDALEGEVGVAWPFTLRHVRLLIERRGALTEKKVEKVEGLLKDAEEAGADALALRKEKARLELRRGSKEQLATARSELEAIIAARPADTDAHVLLAMTLLKQFDRKGADAVARRAVATVPEGDVGLLRIARANISARVGRTVQAAPMARSAWGALLASETSTTADLIDAGALTTRLWTRNKKDAVALRVARELTGRVGYHADAWIIRARTELAANEASDARTSAKKALELDPDNPGAHEIHGHTLLRFGDKAGAKKAYNKAIELAEDSEKAAFRENLGRL
jgi:tetratricopeptide (TPR) repeat protein